MGQDYEIEVVYEGQMGVNFLNRYYSKDVFYGDENSMANPKRLLSKLFIGPANLRDPLERFAERASGYYRMDQNSPVIGPITRVAHKLLGDRTEGLLMPWDGKHSLESNWPNQDSGWMYDWFNHCIPDFDHTRFAVWLVQVEASGDAARLLQAPLCTAAPDAPTTKRSCVVGEELNLASEAVPNDPLPESDFESDDMPALENMGGRMADLLASAEEKTPVVTDKGVKERTKSLFVTAGAQRPGIKPNLCNHPRKPGQVCPCLWKPPSRRKDETAEDHAVRVKEWKKKRKYVAKKHNVTLREESQINGNSGSWTNSDDVESAAQLMKFDFFQFASECHKRLDLEAGFMRKLKNFLAAQPHSFSTLVAVGEWNDLIRHLIVFPDRSRRESKARIFSSVVLVLYLCSENYADVISSFNALNGNNGSATNTDDHFFLILCLLAYVAGRRNTEIITMSVRINQNAPRRRNRANKAKGRQRTATADMRKMQKQLNNLLGQADPGLPAIIGRDAHVVLPGGSKPGRKQRQPRRKAGEPKAKKVAPSFEKFLKANSSAFSTDLAPPFMSFNPQPTLAAQPARAVSSITTQVANNTELWIAVGVQDDVSMDGIAYHVDYFSDSLTTARWLGPYQSNYSDDGTIAPAIGVYAGLTAGSSWTNSLNTRTAFVPVRSWPIATSLAAGGAGAQRYMPTCWDILGINTTPVSLRGGEWITVLPPSSSVVTSAGITVDQLMLNGSYREHGSQEVHHHVPVRPTDMSYRHLRTDAGPGGSTMSNPAGFVIFRNNSGQTQTLRITLAQKYAIGGTVAAALTRNVDLAPHHAGHYETVSSAVTNGMVILPWLPELLP